MKPCIGLSGNRTPNLYRRPQKPEIESGEDEAASSVRISNGIDGKVQRGRVGFEGVALKMGRGSEALLVDWSGWPN